MMKIEDVRCMKLTTGEELLFEYCGISDRYVTVRNPMVAIPTANMKGVQFVRWFVLTDSTEIEIERSAVVAGPETPHHDIAKNYQNQFSPIITPSSGIVHA